MSKPSELITKPHHLVARLVFSLDRSPPSAVDDEWARGQLLPGELDLWDRMSDLDRRHSVKVARRFVARRSSATRAEIAGALLHDVGKVESQLSTVERVIASIVGGRNERYRSYLDHEEVGARLAEAAGSDAATVELIRERGPAFADLHACDRA